MLGKHKHKANWHHAIGCWTLAFGAFLGTSLPANALPEIPQQLAQVRSRAIAPTPLNITPLPGRHISLPRDRSSYRDYYRGYDLNRRFRHRYHRRSRASRGDTTIIIINPENTGKYYGEHRGDRVRIIRP